MEYVVIAFRSRAQTVKFYELLTKNGVKAQIISTPKEAGVGCGLSVRITLSVLLIAKTLLKKTQPSSFAGLFKVRESLGSRFINVIN